jgi:hypothetical protein
MGREEEDEGYMTGSSSRGRRLPMIFMLLAVVAAMMAIIGVAALSAGMAVAKKPAPKPATTGATIEATSFEAAANDQTGDAYAKCPGKKRALGGGVVQIGPTQPTTRGLRVQASGPLNASGSPAQTKSGDIAKQWYAAVFNRTAEPQNFKVFAICSAKSDATIEVKSVQIADKDTGGAWAVCPPNKRALGGGVIPSGGPSGTQVVASSPLDDTGSPANTQSGDIAKQWIAYGSNYSGTSRELKVFAICSARSDATIEAAPFSVPAAGQRAGWVVCPANKLHALGGGVFPDIQGHVPPDLIQMGASGPLDDTGKAFLTQDGDMARQWYTVINNFTNEQKLKVFAICK